MNLVAKLLSGILLGVLFVGHANAAPDIEAGKQRYGMCFNCHGSDGNVGKLSTTN